jgi:hypothetical protein
MKDMIERVRLGLVLAAASVERDVRLSDLTDGEMSALARAAIEAMAEPTDAMWDGLARSIMMWLDMEPRTPRALFQHLKRSGRGIPKWLTDEPEMQRLDHVPSKGTRCVIIYRAMIDAVLHRIDGKGE